MKINSPAFENQGEIPKIYTCQGEDISPPLFWSNSPPNAKSFALIVDDPDAPDPKAPKMCYVHWVLYNLPTDCKGLEEKIARLPAGALNGLNDWKQIGYGGPCPPVGRHRYFFKLYALDTLLKDLKNPTKDKLLTAMKGHILEEAQLIGTYQKE